MDKGKPTQGHIEKLEECSDNLFVSLNVITVNKDGSVKLALESDELNKQVHKNKYQMSNIEELMGIVGKTINERKQGDVFFYNSGSDIRGLTRGLTRGLKRDSTG